MKGCVGQRRYQKEVQSDGSCQDEIKRGEERGEDNEMGRERREI